MNSPKRFFAPLETNPAETRATVAPTTVSKLCALGLEVLIQTGAGIQSTQNQYIIARSSVESVIASVRKHAVDCACSPSG